MTTQLSIVQPLVTVYNNKIVTTSLDIANCFSKQHKNVLRTISSLECSPEFTALNFELSTYTDCTGRNLPVYNITRDGFIFLVTGFTGKKAAQFKEAYIKAFNEMEKALTSHLVPSPPSRTIEVSLNNLIALTNDILWMKKTISDHRLTDALRALGAGELASKLDGRLNNMTLGVGLLNKDNILSSPTNPQ